MKYINIGSVVTYKNRKVTIQKFLDFEKVIIQDSINRELDVAQISELDLESDSEIDPVYLDSINDEDWKLACERFAIIKPLIEAERKMQLEVNKTVLVKELAKKHNVGYSTIYRWLASYNTTNLVSSLVPFKPDGGRGKSRISNEVDQIIEDTIDNFYANGQLNSQVNTAIEVIRLCKNAGLNPPHPNTVYNRIKSSDSKNILNKRLGYSIVSQTIDATPGEFQEAKFPLDMFQIDHTVLDVIVVSEEDRTPMGRPYITVAIDVFSKMVAGFYISMDPPGSLGTGICISNAILPKEDICFKYNLKSKWPVWGIMKNIHLDNAKEFKSKMLIKNSEEYNFVINWRPKGKARYGAHIERYLGTLSKKIHALPGTTFESFKNRRNYDSEARATMTLSELEKWLHIQIVDIYHNEKHSGLKMSPLMKFNEGILGSGKNHGIGIPLMKMNPDKVRLDFLPHIERTIQRTGVVIDHFRYYSEIFRSYLFDNARSGNSTETNYIFKRDPRDITKIYFLDTKEARYIIIPAADLRRNEISLWEWRAAIKKANEQYPKCEITEQIIFDAHNRLRAIEENSKKSKTSFKRIERKRKVEEFKITLSSQVDVPKQPTLNASLSNEIELIDEIDIQPFEFDEEL